MAVIEPYISFAGKTAEAIEFYKSVFGGEANVQLAKDGPNAANTPPEKLEQVFHADLGTGQFHILASDMMSDTRAQSGDISLALMCDSGEQLQEWFDKLADGGKVVWPVRDSEWGALYGQCVDKYGVQWMLNWNKSS